MTCCEGCRYPGEGPHNDDCIYGGAFCEPDQPTDEDYCGSAGHAYHGDEVSPEEAEDAPLELRAELLAWGGRCYCGDRRYPIGGPGQRCQRCGTQPAQDRPSHPGRVTCDSCEVRLLQVEQARVAFDLARALNQTPEGRATLAYLRRHGGPALGPVECEPCGEGDHADCWQIASDPTELNVCRCYEAGEIKHPESDYVL